MSPQLLASLKRAAILLFAMLLPGLVAIYPQLIGDSPLNVHAMTRAFVAAVVGGLISRFGEGVYDQQRNRQVVEQAAAGAPLTALKSSDVGAAVIDMSQAPPPH
jgi:hypothetical protein